MALQVDGHSRHVSCLNHPLLSDREFLGRQLVAQLAPYDDNAAGVLEDSFELVHGFEVVNFRENSNMFSGL